MRSRVFVTVLAAWPLCAGVVRVNVVDRTDVLGGRPIGGAGGYERVLTQVKFALDPENAANRNIRDLALAPRNEEGQVEFTADVLVLRPRDPSKGNGMLLVEVPNRGGQSLLARFQYGSANNEYGDLFLMEQGYTLVWVGWQWDVPQKKELLRAEFPKLPGITGPVRAEFIPWAATTSMPFGDRNHISYPVSDPASVRLTVRDTVTGPRRAVTGCRLSADASGLDCPSGFELGKIYEAVYTAKDPRVAGLGLAAFRDVVSYLRYDGSGVMVLGDMSRYLKQTMAFGISQSGRFLRTFLYYGFNTDEKNRRVFDGVWADVAGAGRGSFNHRFAQASRDGHPFLNTLYPTDIPPYDDYGPNPPKIVLTNSSYEYWGRNGALVTSSTDGKSDLALPENMRVYVYAGGQHGPNTYMPGPFPEGRYFRNPNDFRPMQRAVLMTLSRWVKDGTLPPPSVYPRVGAGELVPPGMLKFPKLAGVDVPTRPKLAYPLDFGPDFESKGIVSKEPPDVGPPFALLVPQVDEDGIDFGGVRMPEVAVPLGGFTGWNLRKGSLEIDEMAGSFFPFAKPRYANKDEYLSKVDAASDDLIRRGFLLERDKMRVHEHAGAVWDAVQKLRQ